MTPPHDHDDVNREPTDLADLARVWRASTARLETRISELAAAIERAHVPPPDASRARAHGRVHRALAVLRTSDVIQLIVAVPIAIASASFWIGHRDELGSVVSGVAFHLYAVATIIAMARRLSLTAQLDLAGPVLATQTAFARMRRFYIRSSLALGLAWWFLWIAGLHMLVRWLLGVDLCERAPAWFWLSLATGGVGVIGSLVLARYLARRAVRSAALAKWADLVAGRSLARVAHELDELTAFAHER
jgi:hypothetical protein